MWRLTTLGCPVSMMLQAMADRVTVAETIFSACTPCS